MTQTLMAEYEDDDKAFPTTDHYLFVGGPKHGEKVEVVTNDPIFKVIAPPAPAPNIGLSGAAMLTPGFDVHTYVRRDLGFETEDGSQWTRAVYCHEQIPNPQVAEHLLMAALLADFVKGGRKVVPDDGVPKLSGQ